MNDPSEKAWQKLNNAAKIFPATSNKTDPKVFRISCELYEAVDGELLQAALERTLEDFPGFCYVLKRGMFWFYLEQSNFIPQAHKEDSPPCGTVYRNSKSLLFDVSWYCKRINLEVYHTLTDGGGAMEFIKTLVLYYLKLVHPKELSQVPGIDYDASEGQKLDDGYRKFYDGAMHVRRIKKPAAYQIKGAREAEGRLKIIEGTLSVKALLAKSKEYNATATVFIAAILTRAICSEMSVGDRKKPVVITVPVNLRNYFASKSSLNFFSTIEIEYNLKSGGNSLEEVIGVVKECFNQQLNMDYLQNRLNKYFAMERNFLVRPIPLSIKNTVMNIAYSLQMREITASLSNVGRVLMPQETRPFIRLFDVFNSTGKLQVCMCSFEDNFNISFTSPFSGTDIQRRFFRELTGLGLGVAINGNNLRK